MSLEMIMASSGRSARFVPMEMTNSAEERPGMSPLFITSTLSVRIRS
jgi:hypothetical protein